MGRGQGAQAVSSSGTLLRPTPNQEETEMITTITPQQLQEALNLRDLTRAEDGLHCMQLLVSAVTSSLASKWQTETILHRGPRVVSVHDNYDALGYPPHGAARDARYTRYVDQGHLLRTQTSAAIPPALHDLAQERPREALIASPGLVWRRDVVDRLHLGELHQLDLWRISAQEMTDAHLEEMMATVVEALLPGAPWRANEAPPPSLGR